MEALRRASRKSARSAIPGRRQPDGKSHGRRADYNPEQRGGSADVNREHSFGQAVWSDEFTNSGSAPAEPNPAVWTYDTGNSGFGNHELENYCAWGSTITVLTANRNAYVGTDGYLHIVARQPSAGVYTSARLKSQGLFSFRYGRVEFRARVPEAQGYWPAAWSMGNNITTVQWPACGEMDILERVNAAKTPDWNEGSVHGTGFDGEIMGTMYNFPRGHHGRGLAHVWNDLDAEQCGLLHRRSSETLCDLHAGEPAGIERSGVGVRCGTEQLYPAEPCHRRRLARRAQRKHEVPRGDAGGLRADLHRLRMARGRCRSSTGCIPHEAHIITAQC